MAFGELMLHIQIEKLVDLLLFIVFVISKTVLIVEMALYLERFG